MCQLIQHFLIFVLLITLKLYFYFFSVSFLFFFDCCAVSLSSCPFPMFIYRYLLSTILISTILIVSFEIILRNSYFICFIGFIDKLVNFFLSAGSDAFICRFILLNFACHLLPDFWTTAWFITHVLFLTFLFHSSVFVSFISKSCWAFLLSFFILWGSALLFELPFLNSNFSSTWVLLRVIYANVASAFPICE